MIRLDPRTEHALRKRGYQKWIEQLDDHIPMLESRFAVDVVKVLPGGVAGLVLLARKSTDEMAIVKSQPKDIDNQVLSLQAVLDCPLAPKLLDYDLSLEALMINYFNGLQPDPGAVSIHEMIAVLEHWDNARLLHLPSLSQWLVTNKYNHVLLCAERFSSNPITKTVC